MTESKPHHQPLDSSLVPRYADVATFLRSPRVNSLDGVDIGIFGVPFDTATFRGGTREGPSAVREASRAIRRVNGSTGVRPFDLASVADLGDTLVNVLDFQGSLSATEAFVHNLAGRGVTPLGIGGDHVATLPILRGMRQHAPFGLLQFDSHADVQDTFFGTKENHASVLRRSVEEGLVDPKRVVQIGLRGTHFGDEDVRWGAEAGFEQINLDRYEDMGRKAVSELAAARLDGRPFYLTFDIDGLDPTEAPGTAAREPGGLHMRDVQVMLRSLTGARVLGADVCEVAPTLDPSGLTALNAANIVFELLCLLAVARAS